MDSLDGRVILVTGSAKRIGRGIALRLAQSGARVAIHYSGSADAARATAAECGNAPTFQANLEHVSEIERLFAEVEQHFGRIDGLVNNAALLVGRKPFQEIAIDEWDRMMAVNVRGTFLCAREASKHMPDGGSIVNVASTTAFNGSQGFLHYVASKGAVVSMTKTLAFELGPKQIRVNCVGPGFTPTEGSAVLGAYDPTATPLGRVMEPDDLLGTYCYLLGDDSKFVSAQTILVNGGRFPH